MAAGVVAYAMGKDEFMDVDVAEAIEQNEGGYWFDFERALVALDNNEANVLSEGDLSKQPRGPCHFFQAGHCQKGRNCPYRHQKPEKDVVCKHWLRGLCKKGKQCEFIHIYDLSKMPECFFYTKYGECTNPECLYRHLSADEKTSECPWYQKGFCKHGERCRYKHAHKILCDNYYLGFCPDGPNCKFGHPKWDAPQIYLGQTDDKSGIKQELRPQQPKTVNMNLICHICQQPGHKAAQCPQKPADNNPGERKPIDQVVCFKCGQRGHYANHCSLPFGVGAANLQGGGGGGGGGGFNPQQQQQTYQQYAQQNFQQQQHQSIPTLPQWQPPQQQQQQQQQRW